MGNLNLTHDGKKINYSLRLFFVWSKNKIQYASWDLAFHMIPFCRLDPNFAQQQLILFLREWYMHPNGQIPG